MKGNVFWVDEEETVAFPDISFLRYRGYEVELLPTAGSALDWFIGKRSTLAAYAAFVVDVQLPINGDSRFVGELPSHGAFAGLEVCRLAREALGADVWDTVVRPKTLLYTRLPDTPRMAKIREFATASNLFFVDKSGDVSLAAKLVDLGLLK